MNAWTDRTRREKVLVAVFGVAVLGATGMKLMAAEDSPVAVDRTPPAASAPGVPGLDPTLETPGGRMDPRPHPKGPGSDRDPFVPNITVGGGSTSSAPVDPATGVPPQETEQGNVTVVLEDIFPGDAGPVAVVKIDGTRFRGRVGRTLGRLVTVVELGARCGVFEQSGEQFGLCVGQTTARSR